MTIRRLAGILVLLLACPAGRAAPAPATSRASTHPASTQPATTRAASDLAPPTRVTLHLDRADPHDAFERLFAAAGLSTQGIEASRFELSRDRKVTVDLVDEPFLAAMLEMCRQSAMEPFNAARAAAGVAFASRLTNLDAGFPAPAGAQLVSAPSRYAQLLAAKSTTAPATAPATMPTPSWVDTPPAIVGPFAFVPDYARRSSGIIPGGARINPALNLQFVILVDPKVRIYQIASTLGVDVAEDEQGRSVVGQRVAESQSRLRGPTGWILNASAQLRGATPQTTHLSKLIVRFNASLVQKSDDFEMTDLSKSSGFTLSDGIKLSVGPLRGTDSEGFVVPLLIARTNQSDEDWSDLRTTLQEAHSARLFDADGRYINVFAGSDPNDGDTTIAIAYRSVPQRTAGGRVAATRPAKIVLSIPAEVQDVSIPVEFKDLPLP